MNTAPPLGVERAELVRALGAALLVPPPASQGILAALGLPPISRVDHTEAFVLAAPPYASIHLGPEGKLGGEGSDRVSGFWRGLGLTPPDDADHLGVLLMSYAQLRDAMDGDEEGNVGVRRAVAALFHEHLWSWAPGYLTALGSSCPDDVAPWCSLTLDVLQAESGAHDDAPVLPLALRAAPPPIDADIDLDDLLDALVAPVRTGIVLTPADLIACARQIGAGYRRGERRFALKAMIEQDKSATLAWLAGLARVWVLRHGDAYGASVTGRWWAERASATTSALVGLTEALRS